MIDPLTEETEQIPGFRHVPRTGVIYVMERARAHGYDPADPQWANLGQGAPEIGPLPDAPPRVERITIDPNNHEYGPITGQIELRKRVAELYNTLYRRDKASQYTYENVSISGGGRVALTRLAAALGNINMGHFLPDYTAYEELLSVFRAFIPIPVLLSGKNGYSASVEMLRREVQGRGLQALLLSNPTNPTGTVVEGEDLAGWANMARQEGCTLILDEFYSHYIYSGEPDQPVPKTVSAAAFVEDVNTDPVIVVDGLTKNWRYPGWRLSWTLGPKSVIDAIASAGSFLDGGANNPFQTQAADLLEPERVLDEARALQKHFRMKRDYVLERLEGMGITVDAVPNGTFYIWANLSQLPEPLNTGLGLFENGLNYKVITVPGIFFDVNPDQRRASSRYAHYARISYGPKLESLQQGLDNLERLVTHARSGFAAG